MWNNLKAAVEEHLPSENTYIVLTMIMMKWLCCTYWPSINKQTSFNKPMRKRKLFKK